MIAAHVQLALDEGIDCIEQAVRQVKATEYGKGLR